MNFLWLIFAHHVADVAFQPSWLIRNKKIHLWSIYEHSMVWTALVSLVLLVLGLFALWKVFFLLIGHFLIDAIKYQLCGNSWWLIYPDQALHYGQIAVVCFL